MDDQLLTIPDNLMGIIAVALLLLAVSFLYLYIRQKKQTIKASLQAQYDNDRISSFSEHSPDALIRVDANERITRWAGQAEQMFQFRSEEVIGKSLYEPIIPPSTRELYSQALPSLLAKANPPRFKRLKLELQRRDGNIFPVEATIILLKFHDHHEFNILVRDLSEQQAAQDKIIKQQQWLSAQQIALNEHAIVSITDAEGNITYANDKFESISQYSKEELIGANHRLLKSHYHSAEFFIKLWDTISNGQVWHGDIQNKAKDGSLYWVKSTIAPLINTAGEAEQYIAIRTDISHIKKLETKLQYANQQLANNLQKAEQEKSYFELLFDKSGYGTAMVIDDRFLNFNAKLAEMMGYQSTIERPKHILDFSPTYQPDGQSSQEKADKIIGLAIQQGSQRVEWLQQKPDGSTFWCDVLITRLNTAPHPLLHVVWRDISVEKKLAEDNQRITHEAIKANQAKSEFLSSMSHELRTPMNSILGFAQLLAADEDEPLSDNQRESLDYILSSGHHLLKLINNVLELATIESGKLILSLEPVDISGICHDVINLLKPLANEANVSIQLKADSDYLILADYTKLKQVIINLVSNAIKYNKNGGQVTLDWQASEDKQLHITVSDTGIGISERDKKYVFAAFNRLNQANSEIEGSGIGLVVTKNLVEMMGGSIGFDSTENIGSNFWLNLPTTNSVDSVDSVDSGSPQKKVLYIEDNVVNQLYIEGVFELHEEYQLDIVESAELGWDYAMQHDIDLILMDINLPGMSGKELTEKLRQTDIYKNKPILAFSASAMKHDIESSKDLFDVYLTKPIQMDELMAAVRQYI